VGFPWGALSDQASEQGQVSYTQQYNLSRNEIANPEASLGGRWLTPDVVQETLQTQTQLGPTVNLPHGSSAGGSLVETTTTTATYTNPGPTALNSARQTFVSAHFTAQACARVAAASCDAGPQRDHRNGLIDSERSTVSRRRCQLAGVFERCS
jgi:hypothetical protein